MSKANSERLEAIHARCLALGGAENLGVNATREMAGCIYEILQMPITQKAIADRLTEQHRRVFQTVSSVETAMTAIDAIDDERADDRMTALWGTLSLVKETLTDIAGHIEPLVMLGALEHQARRDVAGRVRDMIQRRG